MVCEYFSDFITVNQNTTGLNCVLNKLYYLFRKCTYTHYITEQQENRER